MGNWAFYENAIDNKSLVADFKAKFEATEIPVPSDEGRAAALEARAAQDEVAVAEYVKKVDGQIDEASVTLNNIKALPPFGKNTKYITKNFYKKIKKRNRENQIQ